MSNSNSKEKTDKLKKLGLIDEASKERVDKLNENLNERIAHEKNELNSCLSRLNRLLA